MVPEEGVVDGVAVLGGEVEDHVVVAKLRVKPSTKVTLEDAVVVHVRLRCTERKRASRERERAK